MDAEQFKAARKALGLSQGVLAEHLGLRRESIVRYESGERDAPPEIVTALAGMAENVTGPVTSEQTKAQNVTDPFVGLTPWTKPAGLVERNFDVPGYQLRPGWQRCAWRVVSDKIPDPIPYEAPGWAGWRGILTKSGRVYDYETGRQMKPLGIAPRPIGPAPGSRQQLDKKYRRAA